MKPIIVAAWSFRDATEGGEPGMTLHVIRTSERRGTGGAGPAGFPNPHGPRNL